jgi:hypothetical protein
MTTNEDRLTLTVLEDGTARVEVDGISGANHLAADQLVEFFSRLLGGPLRVEKRPEAYSHAHRHGTRSHRH